MIKLNMRVGIADSKLMGIVCGFGSLINDYDEHQAIALVKLDEGFYDYLSSIYITVLAVDINNVIELEEVSPSCWN